MIQKLNNLSKWINDILFSSPNFKTCLSSFPFQFDLLRRKAEARGEEGGGIFVQATINSLEGLIREQGPQAPVLANMVQRPINRSLSILESLSNYTWVWEIEYVITH